MYTSKLQPQTIDQTIERGYFDGNRSILDYCSNNYKTMAKTTKQLPINKAKDGQAMVSICERYLPLMGFEDNSILKKDLFVVPNREAFFQVISFYQVLPCEHYYKNTSS